MDTLLTEAQFLFRKEIESIFETTDTEQKPDVRTSELRSALWGPERSPLDRVLALEELSRSDPGLARNLVGSKVDGPDRGSVYRSAVSLGTAARLLEKQYPSLENLGGAVPSFDSVRRAAQETVDLVTALEIARFLAFRAACLAGTAATEAGAEAARCEKIAVEIAERAAALGPDGRLRQGDRP